MPAKSSAGMTDTNFTLVIAGKADTRNPLRYLLVNRGRLQRHHTVQILATPLSMAAWATAFATAGPTLGSKAYGII